MVNRKHLDSFLLMHILEGEMELIYRGNHVHIPQHAVVLLDLRYPHVYKSLSDKLSTQQYMINGNAVPAYFDLLYSQNHFITKDNSNISYLFHAIDNELQAALPNDHTLSMIIHQILSLMTLTQQAKLSDPIQAAQNYMQKHFSEEITLDEIAEYTSLSKYHFSRKFSLETGNTPWSYLVKLRLSHAMRLLSETNFSVEKIAELCGFSNTSHFIRSFKQEAGITPKQFRKSFFKADSH